MHILQLEYSFLIAIQSCTSTISKLKMVDSSMTTFKCNKRSVVWKHFDFEKKKRQSIGKHCGKSFVYYGGTSNLRAHLKSAHPSMWPTPNSGDEEDKTPVGTKSIELFMLQTVSHEGFVVMPNLKP